MAFTNNQESIIALAAIVATQDAQATTITQLQSDMLDVDQSLTATTTETVCGTYDGKTLYQKIVKYTLTSASSLWIDTGISDSYFIKSINGILKATTGAFLPIPYTSVADSGVGVIEIFTQPHQNNRFYMLYRTNTPYYGELEVVFQYTKS